MLIPGVVISLVTFPGVIVHELAHHHHSDHLSDGYTHECTDLGGKVVQLAIEQPDLFTKVAGEQEHPLALAGARG